MKIEGIDAIKRWKTLRVRRLHNQESYFKRCGKILADSAKKTFDAQGRPQRWEPRKDTNPTHIWPILDKTGRLRDSVETVQDTKDSVYRMDKTTFEFGTKVFYGFIQQVTGVGKAKTKRPFLVLQDDDKENILKLADEWFIEGREVT